MGLPGIHVFSTANEESLAVAGQIAPGEVGFFVRSVRSYREPRARDHLLVTGVKPASEFLNDLTVALKKVL